MMQRWSAETIAFLRDAAEYGDYYRLLAAKLSEYLPQDGHVCDAGCGIGDLANELAKKNRKVTAIDRSEAAIHTLKERFSAQNLNAVCADIFTVQAQFDAMVFCYFGSLSEILELSLRLCRGRVVFAKRNCAEHRFSLGKVPYQHRTGDSEQLLQERGVPYRKEVFSLEFGQPFRSVEAALTFFRLYNRSEQAVTEAEILPRLQKTDSAIFPYYLPMQRDMELYMFDTQEVERG